MKKFALFMLMIVLVTGLIFSGCAKPAPAGPIELTFSVQPPEVFKSQAMASEHIASETEKRTDGRVIISLYYNSVLAPPQAVFDSTLKGACDIGNNGL